MEDPKFRAKLRSQLSPADKKKLQAGTHELALPFEGQKPSVRLRHETSPRPSVAPNKAPVLKPAELKTLEKNKKIMSNYGKKKK